MKTDYLINIWVRHVGEIWISNDEKEIKRWKRDECTNIDIFGFNILFGLFRASDNSPYLRQEVST